MTFSSDRDLEEETNVNRKSNLKLMECQHYFTFRFWSIHSTHKINQHPSGWSDLVYPDIAGSNTNENNNSQKNAVNYNLNFILIILRGEIEYI